ncbi:MAG: peptidylprolyl isomerase [Chamaesiphon sp.]|nr:peptidylprolyl isomerase [Chamaesiphon sp.]
MFTTDAIYERLSKSELLPQLLREMIIDEILADGAIDLDGKIPYDRNEFAESCDRLGKLAGYQGLNQLQLYKIVDRHLRLKKIKYARWNSRVYSYYLKHKSRFDRVEFSLMGVTDLGLAEELFFRVQRGEQSFAELAFKYSKAESAKDGGKISSNDLGQTHPRIFPHLASLRPSEMSIVFTLDNLYVFVRLEGYISAELNDELNQLLIDELFETWMQQQISTRLGLFEVEAAANIPELSHDYQSKETERELLEQIDRMDEQQQVAAVIELIEPSASFFFPKELPNPNYDFKDSADRGVSSSFFFPKETPTQIIRKTQKLRNSQKIISFLFFFLMFLGLEIVTLNIWQCSVTPSLDVGSSHTP